MLEITKGISLVIFYMFILSKPHAQNAINFL